MTLHLLQTVTPTCVGEGTAAGAVDLPVARERHTGWPFLPGSSVKGALRARAEVPLSRDDPAAMEALEAVFGNTTCRGGLVVSDATLLALPTRSLAGGFVLLTCPLALDRLARSLPDAPAVPRPALDRALATPALAEELTVPLEGHSLDPDVAGVLLLEDLDWLLKREEALTAWVEVLRTFVASEAPVDRLVVVADDVFAYAAASWLPVRTRAAIGEDGVVKPRQLFTTESLPDDTLLWLEMACEAQTDGHLLPDPGEVFAIGRGQSIGQGRVVLHRQRRPHESR